MKTFDYKKETVDLFTPGVVNLVAKIHEFRGKQDLYIQAKSDILEALGNVAKIQSTGASNRIEGIYTSDARLAKIVEKKTEPQNRNEEEIAGYRDVLTTIHENHDHIRLSPNIILQLHRDMYSYHADTGGQFKGIDNVITETDAAGVTRVRFVALSALETPEAMQRLCSAYHEAIEDRRIDPLIVISQFILDFLCIHPFADGNGRLSRLLTLLLLYQQGYIVGKYISLEMITEESKVGYYDALEDSSTGWHEDRFTYAPYVRYQLGVILRAYREFSSRVETVSVYGLNKTERIKDLFNKNVGKLSKSDIARTYPDISLNMIEKVLADLLNNGQIKKVGAGRSTAYVKEPEKLK